MNKENLLNQFREVECNLSPENLCCDGEASVAWIRKEGGRLHRLRKQIIAQLGYEPTYKELYEMD